MLWLVLLLFLLLFTSFKALTSSVKFDEATCTLDSSFAYELKV